VQHGIVVFPDRSCDAALREQARRGEERPLRQDEHVTLGSGAERGEEAGDAPADHDEVEFGVAPCVSRVRHGSFRL
jgi:hypothetical protein